MSLQVRNCPIICVATTGNWQHTFWYWSCVRLGSSDGDLDGDGKDTRCVGWCPCISFAYFVFVSYSLIDYFVLWDERIIHHLMNSKDKLTSKSRKLLNTLELPPDRETHSVKKGDNNSASRDNYWLSKAQDVMLWVQAVCAFLFSIPIRWDSQLFAFALSVIFPHNWKHHSLWANSTVCAPRLR